MWKFILGTVVYFGAWFALGRYARVAGKEKLETLAWLLGGISALMSIFLWLRLEMTALGAL